MGLNFNIGDVRKELEAYKEEAVKSVKAAGDFEANAFFEETKLRVPKETNALLESGKLTSSGSKERFEWTVKYGDSNVDGVGVDYAAAVHERVGAYHAPPTGAKYVEGPLVQWIPKFKRAFSKAMQAAR